MGSCRQDWGGGGCSIVNRKRVGQIYGSSFKVLLISGDSGCKIETKIHLDSNIKQLNL